MKINHIVQLINNLAIPDRDISVQLLKKGTIPLLAQLAYQNKPFLEPWLAWVTSESSLDSFIQLFTNQIGRLDSGENIQSILFLIQQNEQCVGMLNIQPRFEEHPTIEFGFWVDKSAQGRGITSKVLNIVSETLSNNIDNITLRIKTFENNKAAIQVAKSSGFIQHKQSSIKPSILVFERS